MKSSIKMFGICMLMIVCISVITASENNSKDIYELRDPSLSECRVIREYMYNKYHASEEPYTQDDARLILDFRSRMAKDFGINEKEYILDMWSCTFFRNEKNLHAKVTAYREQRGLYEK